MQREKGFTLLEVLIALVILGIAVASIFDLMKVGLFSSAASEGYSRAVFHANAVLGELLVKLPIEPGASSDTFEDGYSYEANVTRYELGSLTAAAQGAPTSEVYLYDVVVHIPNQTRTLRLQTLRSIPTRRDL